MMRSLHYYLSTEALAKVSSPSAFIGDPGFKVIENQWIPAQKLCGNDKKKSFVSSLIIVLLIGACAHQEPLYYTPDPDRLKEVETKVMEGGIETPTLGDPIITLTDHEAFMLSYFGEKSEIIASAMHRLADLYLTLEDRDYQQNLTVYTQRLRLYQQGRLKKPPPSPVAPYSRSLRVYEKILEGYPNQPENDRVLYQLARIYEANGSPKQKDEMLKRLVVEYPNSPYLPEVQFRLAESYFAAGMLREAAAAYQAAAWTGDFSVLDRGRKGASGRAEIALAEAKRREEEERALYKAGWTLINLEDFRGAIDTFRSLLDRKREIFKGQSIQLDPKVMSPGEWNFVQEVLRGMVIAFSYWPPPTNVQSYFETIGHRDYEYWVYRKLGDLYQSRKLIFDAIQVYEAFLKAYPMHHEAPHLALAIIEAYQRLQLVDLSNSARIRFLENFGERSSWYRNTSAESRAKVGPFLKQTTYQLALFYHSEAQKTRRPKDYEKAIEWYRKFLAAYPLETESGRVNFLLAEGLYEIGKDEEAVTQYEKAAYQYPLHQDSAESGYAAILALEKKWNLTAKTGTAKSNPLALQLAQACVRFAKAFPTDDRVIDVQLKGAEIYFQARHFEEARNLSEEITRTHLATRHPSALKAQRVIANSYFEEGAYVQAAEVYRQLNMNEAPEAEREEVRRLWASALYKQAEGFKGAGKLKEAEAAFYQVQREVPGSEVAPVALYDAGLIAMDGGDLNGAMQAFGLLVSQYPEASHAVHAALKIARIHEQQGKLKEAATEYEKVPTLTKDRGMAAEALLAAGWLYEQLGDWAKLEPLYQIYLDGYAGEFEKVVEIRFKIIEVKQRLGRDTQVRELLGDFIKQYSLSQEGPSASSAAGGGQVGYYLARAYLSSARYLRKEYDAVKLVPPLEDNLAQKRRLLSGVLDLYIQAVEYKIGEMVTEATYQIGTAFEEFRTALLESERPQGLTSQQLEQYNFLLEEQAYPFEERAISAYESNVRRAQELGLYDSWVKQSFNDLARLIPGRYQKPELKEMVSQELVYKP